MLTTEEIKNRLSTDDVIRLIYSNKKFFLLCLWTH